MNAVLMIEELKSSEYPKGETGPVCSRVALSSVCIFWSWAGYLPRPRYCSFPYLIIGVMHLLESDVLRPHHPPHSLSGELLPTFPHLYFP